MAISILRGCVANYHGNGFKLIAFKPNNCLRFNKCKKDLRKLMKAFANKIESQFN
jgi:hypothetical protein